MKSTLRSENVERWQRIAGGALEDELNQHCRELRAWIREVAVAIVKANEASAGRLPLELQKAVGLVGQHDSLGSGIRKIEAMLRDLSPLDEHGRDREPQRGEMTRLWVKWVRHLGLVADTVTDEEIRKRVAWRK